MDGGKFRRENPEFQFSIFGTKRFGEIFTEIRNLGSNPIIAQNTIGHVSRFSNGAVDATLESAESDTGLHAWGSSRITVPLVGSAGILIKNLILGRRIGQIQCPSHIFQRKTTATIDIDAIGSIIQVITIITHVSQGNLGTDMGFASVEMESCR